MGPIFFECICTKTPLSRTDFLETVLSFTVMCFLRKMEDKLFTQHS